MEEGYWLPFWQRNLYERNIPNIHSKKAQTSHKLEYVYQINVIL